jgi:general secretion pathway protein D
MNARGLVSVTLLSMILTAPAFCGESALSSQRIKPDFVDMPLEKLAEAITAATGKTFVIQPGLRISLTLKADRPLTSDELYEAFLRTLDRNGLGALPQGGYIRIAKKTPLIEI